MGDISKWNDPRIKKLNPKLALPATAIAPVYRSDGSGTNFLFSDYLSKESPKFSLEHRRQHLGQWPVGIGAKGNEGVANMTTQTDGAIGYVEYAYAKQNKMAYALLANKSGAVVEPSAEIVPGGGRQRRLGQGRIRYYLILTDQPGAKSWPITGASFILRVQAATRSRSRWRRHSSSSPGPTRTAPRWPPSSITCRCRQR